MTSLMTPPLGVIGTLLPPFIIVTLVSHCPTDPWEKGDNDWVIARYMDMDSTDRETKGLRIVTGTGMECANAVFV